MNKDIQSYNESQEDNEKLICNLLALEIGKVIPQSESKVWHGSPVWFIEGNPITGYSVLKDSVRLLFWSGQSFDEPKLSVEGSFKAAEAKYKNLEDVNKEDLQRWLDKSIRIQWDYKNIVKRRGELIRLK